MVACIPFKATCNLPSLSILTSHLWQQSWCSTLTRILEIILSGWVALNLKWHVMWHVPFKCNHSRNLYYTLEWSRKDAPSASLNPFCAFSFRLYILQKCHYLERRRGSQSFQLEHHLCVWMLVSINISAMWTLKHGIWTKKALFRISYSKLHNVQLLN